MVSTAQDVTSEVAKYIKILEGEKFKIAYHNGIVFENYAISNFSRLFTFNHRMLMSKRIHKNGYGMSRLSKSGKIHYIGTHRIVGFAFVENKNPNEYTMVNHIDEKPSNNHWTNLEWCDCKENLNWGTAQIRRAFTRAKAVKAYKVENNKFVGIFESMPKAALACNTTTSSVCIGCKSGIPKKGFIFEYA